MKGVRVMPDENGFLDPVAMRQPGAYGRCTAYDRKYPGSPLTFFEVTAPNGDCCCLDPKVHQIIEHDDGTITVNPSIQFPGAQGQMNGWHGYLKSGEWTT